MNKLVILCVLVCAAQAFAAMSIDVTAPHRQTMSDGDPIDLGTIGPGQTIYIDFNPRVEGVGYWAEAKVSGLPNGWYAKDSRLYEDPLHVRVTSAKDGNPRKRCRICLSPPP